MNKQIGIVVLFWNDSKKTISCLKSIFKQKNINYSLVLVDNNSNKIYSNKVFEWLRDNNKNVLFYPSDTDGFSLLAMIKNFDIDVNLIRERYKNDYVRLINNEVDVMPAYITNEPFLFKQQNLDP